MRKFLSFLGLLSVLVIIFSCVPPDPATVYGWNSNMPGSTISGPRILHKIDSSNVTVTEYVSTASGVLEQVLYPGTGSKITVFYSANNKVNRLLIEDSNMSVDLLMNYDGTGKVISAQQLQKLGSVLSGEVHYTLMYNSAGKVIKVDKKVKDLVFTNSFTQYGEISLVWSGDNVVKISENSTGIIHPDGSLEPLNPAGNITFKFEDYDNKISPYTTLAKEFNLGMGLMSSAAFGLCSYNNPLKIQIEPFFNMPPIVNMHSYVYDSYNYLVTDQQGTTKYIYKAIQ